MAPFLDLSYLTKSYPTPRGPAVIVRDFHLTVQKGEFVTLLGHSGCGKSTVLAMVAGLIEPTSGGAVLAGKEITGPGPDRGVVFQSPCLLPWLTALDNVLLGVNQVFRGSARADRVELARYYLDLVGLPDSALRKPGELSQGMRQRVGLARAFALSPRLLLLDEPFGMLDSLTRCELQDVLLDLWARDRRTALMVTHDVDEALFLSDRIVLMTDGPAATVGEVIEVDLPRPRSRRGLFEEPAYDRLRQRVIGFLEARSRPRTPAAEGADAPPSAEPAPGPGVAAA